MNESPQQGKPSTPRGVCFVWEGDVGGLGGSERGGLQSKGAELKRAGNGEQGGDLKVVRTKDLKQFIEPLEKGGRGGSVLALMRSNSCVAVRPTHATKTTTEWNADQRHKQTTHQVYWRRARVLVHCAVGWGGQMCTEHGPGKLKPASKSPLFCLVDVLLAGQATSFHLEGHGATPELLPLPPPCPAPCWCFESPRLVCSGSRTCLAVSAQDRVFINRANVGLFGICCTQRQPPKVNKPRRCKQTWLKQHPTNRIISTGSRLNGHKDLRLTCWPCSNTNSARRFSNFSTATLAADFHVVSRTRKVKRTKLQLGCRNAGTKTVSIAVAT